MTQQTDAPSSNHLAKFMQGFFLNEGWTMEALDVSEDDATFGTVFGGKNGRWPCIATVVDDQIVSFYSMYPEEIPQSRYQACAEFTCRVNFGLLVGAFEFNLDDGELRFRTSANLDGIALPDMIFQHIVYTNIANMDRYLPALREVIDGTTVAISLTKHLPDLY